jgi:hypothetical protein
LLAHKPTQFYYKNFKGSSQDRDYFYDRTKTLGDSGEIKRLDDHISSDSNEDSDELRATMVNKSNTGHFHLQSNLGSITRENVQNRYRFEKPLGEGAFGKVKVASLHADHAKKYAVKSIPRSLFANKSDGEKDGEKKDAELTEVDEAQMVELLQQEIQVVMGMDHPNIVKFYQCVYDNQYLNITMELVRGKPLSDYLEEKGKIPEPEC